jgi:homogentisate 1,2-dioxygenase
MIHHAKGTISRQGGVNTPAGTFEESFGRQGFFGPQSKLYRRHPTTDWTRIEGPLQPRALRTYDVSPDDMIDANGLPATLLYNDDVSLSVSRRQESMPLFFRNGDGDELHFIHQGQGRFECDFGVMSFEPGDYILIPRGTNYRFVYTTTENFSLIVESRAPIGFPERGIIGQHAPFDYTLLDTPELEPVRDEDGQEWELRIKKRGQYTSVFYDFYPMDVVGWHGSLSVLKLNVRDIRPLMSDRIHLPPSAHTTFQASGFVVCTFVPRPLEGDPSARRVPSYHRNVDYDEVFFTHSGEFALSGKPGARPMGVLTLNPAGLQHGPQPGVEEASRRNWKKDARMEFTAVNLDTEQPMLLTDIATAVEIPDYYTNWMRPSATATAD